MIKVSELFNITYGNGLELNSLDINEENGINFISRTSKNNGVSAKVERIIDTNPNEAGLITVSLGGSVLEAFLQTDEFYTGYHIFCLSPKINLTEKQKLFYCLCIRANKYRYSYGRQANKTLGDILIPEINEFPNWINTIKIPIPPHRQNVIKGKFELNTNKWQYFQMSDIFYIKYGTNLELNKLQEKDKGIPFVSRTAFNNGVSAYVEPLENVLPNPERTISVSGGGSVLECFLQERPYYSGRDLYYFKSKENLSKFALLFVCNILRKEKYRFNYGRQANKALQTMQIKLPVDKKGNPDWEYMENYIKSLPYSSNL